MSMVLNEEQRLLKNSIKGFLQANAPIELMRQLRDEKDSAGYSQTVWQQLVELGVTSAALPEKLGGLGFGYLGLGAALEEMGRTLTASPLFSSIVLGASAIELGGSEEQQAELLPQISSGDLLLALALNESPHHRPEQTATKLEKSGDALILNGNKVFVLDGHSANRLLVVARSSGQPGDSKGLSLVLLAADTAGVTIQRTHLMDGRNTANIAFNNVSVPASQLIGAIDDGMPVLQAVLDRGAICMAAEMLGGVRETFERTVEFLKEREQFGVIIGSFQALQHRAANLLCEIEACKSAVLGALAAIDAGDPQLSSKASLAKTLVNGCYQHVTNESVQLHGGMGVTDELDIGLFLKRARVCAQIMGDSRYHKNRYASLQGY